MSKEDYKLKGFLVFFISLLVSICFFGTIYVLFTIYTQTEVTDNKANDIPYISNYNPSRDEDLTILIIGCEVSSADPSLVTLLDYNAPEGEFNIITLPTSLICTTSNGRTDSIVGHYNYEGIRGCVDAVSNLFSLKNCKYIRIQQNGLSNMVDFFGGLPYTITTYKQIGEQDFFPGEQLLDGRRFSTLLLEITSKGVSDNSTQADLLYDIFSKSFNLELVDRYDNFVKSIFFNCETDINQLDLAKSKTGFLNRLKLESLVIDKFALKGDYSNDYSEFYPNATSFNAIAKILS